MINTAAIRKRILALAMQGKLVEQSKEDASAFVSKMSYEINGKPFKMIINKNELPYSELSKGWVWCRLSDIGTTNIGLTYHPEDIIEDGLIVLRSNNIQNGKLVYDDLVRVNCDIRDNQYLSEGDILICARNGSKNLVGKCAIYEGLPEKVSFGAFMAVFRTVCSRYVYYYFHTDLFRRYFSNDDTKQINQVTQKILKNAVVPFPPISEQQRIVEKIDKIFKMLDKIDKLQREYCNNVVALKLKIIEAGIRGQLTEQLPEDGVAEELYNQIIERKEQFVKDKTIKKSKALPEISKDEIPFDIPSTWKWVRLENIATHIASGSTPTGGHKSDVYVEEGCAFFREQNIYNEGIREEGLVYITEELLATRKNSTVYAGDILLNITGGSIGRCALVPADFDKGSINQHILIIRMVEPEMRFYVHCFLCSPYAQKYIRNASVGDKDGFSGGRCKSMLIPLLPLPEQKRIVAKIDAMLSYF
ncbi:MAG: restriction endonuclease subunit S [Eubacterium sp.]|nr:restriction endonuclease subunit S [Eubacterium sp.]